MKKSCKKCVYLDGYDAIHLLLVECEKYGLGYVFEAEECKSYTETKPETKTEPETIRQINTPDF